MKDWKMWAPLQTKKQREVADNLSATKKEEATRLAKELGMKGAFFGISCSLVYYFIYEYTSCLPMLNSYYAYVCLYQVIYHS